MPRTEQELFDDRFYAYVSPYAKHNGITPSHFSFNRPGGRCEECQGEGVIRVEMQFMADVELKCEHCGGERGYKDKALFCNHQIF